MPSFRHRVTAKIANFMPECITTLITDYMIPLPNESCRIVCGVYNNERMMFVTRAGGSRVFHHDACPDVPGQCMFCHEYKPDHDDRCVFKEKISCPTPERCVPRGIHSCIGFFRTSECSHAYAMRGQTPLQSARAFSRELISFTMGTTWLTIGLNNYMHGRGFVIGPLVASCLSFMSIMIWHRPLRASQVFYKLIARLRYSHQM